MSEDTLNEHDRRALRARGWTDAEIDAVDADLLADLLADTRSTMSATPKPATASVEWADEG